MIPDLGDRMLLSFLKTTEEAIARIAAWESVELSFPDHEARILIQEVAFKADSAPSYGLMTMRLVIVGGDTLQYDIESVEGQRVPTDRGLVMAKGALYTWAGACAKNLAERTMRAVRAARSAGLVREDLDSLWDESIVREVMSA